MSIRESVGSLLESHRAKSSRPDWTNFTSNPQGFRPQRIFRFPNYEAPPRIAADLEFPATDPPAPNSGWASFRRTITSRPLRPLRRRRQRHRSRKSIPRTGPLYAQTEIRTAIMQTNPSITAATEAMSSVKTTNHRFNGAFCAVVVVIVVSMTFLATAPQARAQGVVNVDFYFGVAPANSPNYTTFIGNMIQGMQNPSASPVSLILPGSTISATNTFVYQDNTGNILLTGAHVSSTTPFLLNQITWTFFSSAWAFTNVFNGTSFGTAIVGENGGTMYTSGSSAGIYITDLWIIPRAYSYLIKPGDTTSQGLVTFALGFGSNLLVTQSATIGSSIFSGTVNLQAVPAPPTPTIAQVGKNIIVSWPNSGSYTLLQNSNLASGTWVTNLNAITTSNGTNSITLTPSAESLFFRLKQ